MAGYAGNVAYLGVAKQTAKGTPAAAGKHKMPLSGSGRIAPQREVDQLSETDSDRDPGVSYVKMASAGGSPEVYVRDNNVDFFLAAVLGAVADSGATNFIHTITPAVSLPYLTMWSMVGGALFEQANDVQINELTLRSEAGGPLTVGFSAMGLDVTRSATELAVMTSLSMETGAVYTQNDMQFTTPAGMAGKVSSFEMTISNNLNFQQTESFKPMDMAPGKLEVTFAFDLIFDTLSEYNTFHYGSGSGTTLANAVVTQASSITFSKGVNNSLALTIPNLAYEEFPVEVSSDGSPIVVPVRARAERNAGALITAVVKNQKATTF